MLDPRLGSPRHRQTTTEHGVLGGRCADFQLDRIPAHDDLADLVERHWIVTWALPRGQRSAVTLLPHPCVNLVFDHGQAAIAGVGRERFTYELTGRGRVFGVKFRPGAFRPFLGGPVSQLTGQLIPLASLWGSSDADCLAGELAGAGDPGELVDVAERHLRAHWPAPDPEVVAAGRIVHAMLHDRTITRVCEVSQRFGMSARSLQRLFDRYVGVSPKWVLRRYRLHEAAARLAERATGSWAELAVELGYVDQPHFIRDFARAVGMTPVAYAEACRRGVAPVST